MADVGCKTGQGACKSYTWYTFGDWVAGRAVPGSEPWRVIVWEVVQRLEDIESMAVLEFVNVLRDVTLGIGTVIRLSKSRLQCDRESRWPIWPHAAHARLAACGYTQMKPVNRLKVNHACVLKSVWQCPPMDMGYPLTVEVQPSRMVDRKPKQQHSLMDRMK